MIDMKSVMTLTAAGQEEKGPVLNNAGLRQVQFEWLETT